MPDPKSYDNKNEWMDACMHQVKKVEGKPQGQSVAICLSMWRNKDKKKKKKTAADIIRGIVKESFSSDKVYYPQDGVVPDGAKEYK